MIHHQEKELSPDQAAFIEEFISDGTEEMSEEEQALEAQKQWEDQLQNFGNGVESEAQEYERLRKPIEDRMLEDMRQYMGVEETIDKLNKKKTTTSDVSVNITRKKANAAEAKLSDMLFPTDDKNWGLEVSPDPSLPPMEKEQIEQQAQQQVQQQEQAQAQAAQQQQAGGGMPQQMGPAPVPGQPQPMGPAQAPMQLPQGEPGQGLDDEEDKNIAAAEEAEAKEAKKRCEAMSNTMDDQMSECRYGSIGREVIHYGCLLGTGIMKGPVLLGKTRRAWVKKSDPAGNVAYVLEQVTENTPGFEFVPTWDFFPDLSATRIEDSEINFQRHWMTRRDLIRLAKRPDFLTDQIRRVLMKSPDRTPPDYLTQLRSMSDITAVGDEKRYVVWERHGPVDISILQGLGIVSAGEDIDPLMDFQSVVWVCQGVVIKVALYPLETGEHPFSVFCFEEDDSCIFGYGVPYLMRQPAKVVKQAWRMIMDNAGLSVGGQVILNRRIIEPAPEPDGSVKWDITPLKVWLMKDKNGRAQDAFHVFEIPNHQEKLAAIFSMAKQLADEETGIPVIAEGEQGLHVTQTAHGMEMLMNNHNIVMRRAVKNWDDCVTIPNIQRLYDWNMQNNDRDDIKGDFTPIAKGSTALLLKETQARNMLQMVNFLMSPAFVGWVKQEQMVRKLVSSMQHDPDELIKTEKEYRSDMEKAAKAGGGDGAVQVQQMKNQLAMAMHKDKMAGAAEDRKLKALIADTNKETEMLKLAQTEKVTLAKIAADLQKIREKSVADRTLMADEFKVKLETGSGV